MARYQFELDRRSLYQVLGGLVLSLFLAFGAGMVVGLRLQLPDDLASGASATETEETEVAASPGDDEASTLSDESAPDGRSDRSARLDDREAIGAGGNDGGDPGSTGTVEGDESSSADAGAMEASSNGSAPDGQASDVGAASSSASITSPYTIQLGSFGEREKAQALVRRLQRDDYAPVIEPERRDGRTFYQVWIGEYDSFSGAAEKLSTFREYASSAFVERTN